MKDLGSKTEEPKGGGVLVALLLLFGVGLSLLFGAQTASWSWGPSMLAMGLAVMASLWGRAEGAATRSLVATTVVASVWFLYRILTTEALDDARADFLLLVALLGAALVTLRLSSRARGVQCLMVGLSCCVFANAAVALVQWQHPGFMWPYANRPTDSPTGFFGHYNYFSNFIAGVGLLALARAVFAPISLWERMFHGAAFAIGALAIWLSGSRGGTVALGVGIAIGLVAAAFWAWRCKSRWLPAVVVALPLLLVGGLFFGWMVLSDVQERRNQSAGGVTGLADNSSRLNWIGLAGRVVMRHPWTGGGSRSYAWERNLEWDQSSFGWGGENEPFVHNELLQAATDYGLIGAVLVLLVIGCLFWTCFASLVLGGSREVDKDSDWVRIGVLAAASAMLLQANVSFVFHMMPSALLLGIILGLAMRAGRSSAPAALGVLGSRLSILASILLISPLIWFGWRGTQALHSVWPVMYAHQSLAKTNPEGALQALDRGITAWPGYQLSGEKAALCRQVAEEQAENQDTVLEWQRLAVDAYLVGLKFHPHNAVQVVNLANSYSILGLNEEAEKWFEHAMVVQGELESSFRGRFYYARHLHALWFARWTGDRRAGEALSGFRLALGLLDEADERTPPHARGPLAKDLRKSLEDSIEFLEGAGVEAVPLAD